MTQTTDPTATVQKMFAAFGAGDLDAVIETLHPESRWTYRGANPRLSKAVFIGPDEVRGFFTGLLAKVNVTAFDPSEYIVDDDRVVVFGSEAGTVKASGDAFRNEWVQKYVVKDGLITEMDEYNIQVDPRA